MPASVNSVENVKLGACDVSFNAVDLGLTKGGVKVSFSTQKKDVTVDQFGETIMNSFIMGRTGTVTVPMAETDLTKLASVIPGATLITDHTTSSKKKLVIPTAVGTSLIDTAAVLVLHPTALASSDKSEDVTVPLASPTGQMSFEYQFQNERVYNVEFQMYPDPATGLLFTIGDPTASLT